MANQVVYFINDKRKKETKHCDFNRHRLYIHAIKAMLQDFKFVFIMTSVIATFWK